MNSTDGSNKEPVEVTPDCSIATPRGFIAGTARCGLKKSGEDLAIVFSEVPAVAAAVFTRNLIQAAPVILSRQHLRSRHHRLFVVNAGCANACTGDAGLEDARQTAQIVAEYFDCDQEEVIVASTGVIGVPLDMTKLTTGLRTATASLSRENGWSVAEAIMTTDTRPKRALKTVRIGGRRVTIAGVAKGAGMIHPDMATLLSLVTTDAAISKSALRQALNRAVNCSFNRVTVDGDTSTNDTLAVFANGLAGNAAITGVGHPDFQLFTESLTAVCRDLAIQVARDGEGARKLIVVNVRRAPTEKDAHRIASTIATSPLVKTAIAGQDANWGRILAAAGRSGVKFDPSLVSIRIGNLTVARQGRGLKFDEVKALEVLSADEVVVTLDLAQGEAEVTEWTCDLTEDYIRINADYRS
ncbi:MAG: bifunctional glutamate N-acetyltransferase/amino-acid acetyltransferase ArgJ [Acidobacteria bacterium]|nr:bifunctional glutamate N-acetyltransferase/amino-acid acetyltransferase ArgJ [Acidobacteriota bacterium]